VRADGVLLTLRVRADGVLLTLRVRADGTRSVPATFLATPIDFTAVGVETEPTAVAADAALAALGVLVATRGPATLSLSTGVPG